jgi:hypothetical protein
MHGERRCAQDDNEIVIENLGCADVGKLDLIGGLHD